jgi:alkanesulfonate monooxygenase SsuD/methylene tetrahydromethanopterin reductase-like flavin-dependent oxidoreductase (luciferase family)
MASRFPFKWGMIFGGDNLSMAELLRYAKMADDAAADSVWHAEVWRDAFVPLTAMASVVRRARLGTAIAQLARPPWHAEMSAMSLAEVAEGRFVLGLGTGPPMWNQQWHGLTLTKPVTRLREYVECIRTMWTGSPTRPVSYAGEFYRVQDYARFMPAPAAPPPIYLAAVQAGMLRLAGSIADGWISGPMTTVRYMNEIALPNLQRGRAAARRADAAFERCVIKPCVVHRDRERARSLARNAIAVYGGFPALSYYDVATDPEGFAPTTQKIRAALTRGDIPGMLDAVSDEMIDALTFSGTPDEVRRQIVSWEGLVDVMLLYCPPALTMDPAETRATHEAIIETFAT